LKNRLAVGEAAGESRKRLFEEFKEPESFDA